MRSLTSALAALILLLPLAAHAARQTAPAPSSSVGNAHEGPSRTSMRPPMITEAYAKRTIVAAVRAKTGHGKAVDVKVTFPAGFGIETNPRFLTELRPAPNVRFAAPLRTGTYGRIDTLKLSGSPEGADRVAPHKYRPR